MHDWSTLANWLSRKSFSALERVNLHLTPVHFYSAIPNTREIPDEFWQQSSELPGLDLNEEAQLSLLETFVENYRKEYEKFPRRRVNGYGAEYEYYVQNRYFEAVDGEMLYCLVRHFKPARIVEIGSGFSTYLTAQAIRENRREGHDCRLTAIEPFPNDALRKGFDGLSELRAEKVQDVELSFFTELDENDFLVIDSSHVLHLASDVRYELLEIVPRLNPGVLVHFHDVFLPAHYPRSWVEQSRYFWTEQYALQAFLAFNDAFEVLWAGSWMHMNHEDRLRAAFPSYSADETWPGSFWIRRKV